MKHNITCTLKAQDKIFSQYAIDGQLVKTLWYPIELTYKTLLNINL